VAASGASSSTQQQQLNVVITGGSKGECALLICRQLKFTEHLKATKTMHIFFTNHMLTSGTEWCCSCPDFYLMRASPTHIV
jgi:hypothetical protein